MITIMKAMKLKGCPIPKPGSEIDFNTNLHTVPFDLKSLDGKTTSPSKSASFMCNS